MIKPKESTSKIRDYIPFKILFQFDQRKSKYQKAMQKVDQSRDMVLIILEPHPKTKYQSILIKNCKFSCETCHTVNYIKQQILNRIKKQNNESRVGQTSFFLYCSNTMLMGDRTIGSVRDQFQDKDGFLYIHYSEMDVYG